MRESFTNAVNSTEFQTSMKSGIKNVICNVDFQGIYNNLADRFKGVMGGFSAKDYSGGLGAATE